LSRARSAKWRVRGTLKSEGIDGLIVAVNRMADLLTETTARGKRPLKDYAEDSLKISTMIWPGAGAEAAHYADEPDRQLCAAHRGRRLLPASRSGSRWAEPSIR
jgi:hypothetical protein